MNTEEKKDKETKHEPIVIRKTKKVLSDIFNEDVEIEFRDDDFGKVFLYMEINGHEWKHSFDDDLDRTQYLGFVCDFLNEIGKSHGKNALEDFYAEMKR